MAARHGPKSAGGHDDPYVVVRWREGASGRTSPVDAASPGDAPRRARRAYAVVGR